MKQVNRCVYCQSTNYGKGCMYAPNGVHFHPDDPKLCSYCGSSNYGTGCHMNPFGKVHIHGIFYNSMVKESFLENFFIKEIFRPITEFRAYKLGIIDENGNKLKEPVTEEERQAFTPAAKTLIKVKRYLGSKLELIQRTAILEKESKMEYTQEKYKINLEYQDRFNDVFADLHKLTDEALRDGLSLEQIESLLRK